MQADSFDSVENIEASSIAKWNGKKWKSLGKGVNSSVDALSVYANELFIAGTFDTVDNKAAKNMVKWTTKISPK